MINSIKRELKRTKGISRAVMMEHTLFSLPLAIVAFVSESGGKPQLSKVFWIILAVFTARNGANALNRIIDNKIDKANPRTSNRDIPSGRVKIRDLWIFIILCGLIFILSAWKLNTLCLLLVPVALILVGGYSFSKRFTWLCHYWLGVTCAIAVMGSFLAITGSFELRFFPLTIAASLWIAGFDIIYALQDIDHDRNHNLFSVPARFGRKGALYIAGLSHIGTILFFIINSFFYQFGAFYFVGVIIAALLLLSEHLLAWNGNLKWIPLASYHLNQILSPMFMFFTLLDIYLPGGIFGN